MTADSPNKIARPDPGPTGVRLRRACPDNYEALAALRLLVLPATDSGADTPSPALRRLIAEGCILIASQRGRPVAYAGFDPDQAALTGPCVDPSQQRQGIGTRLLTAVERLAASMQLFQLSVQSPKAVIGFFKDRGYRQNGPATDAPVLLARSFPRRQTVQGRQVAVICESLGIPGDYALTRRLPLQPEARNLRTAGKDIYDRPQRLTPGAVNAWAKMRTAASEAGIELQLVSAFRSVEYQAGLISRKLEKGISMGDVLAVSAAPGYSEHHTGLALDITTPGSPVLEEVFETTDAFRWLLVNAGAFGFHLSYPRDNPHGVAYEPWHWAYKSTGL